MEGVALEILLGDNYGVSIIPWDQHICVSTKTLCDVNSLFSGCVILKYALRDIFEVYTSHWEKYA